MTQRQLMMDSGAFTVWNIGGEVDLPAYIQFCKDYEDVIDSIVALDVIPDSLSPGAIEAACQQGWDNYQMMIEAGLPKDKVLPVFHQFDGFHWLQKYTEDGVPYIGLSHRKKGVSREQQMMWLDSCMNLVCDSEGNPLVKTHGFGLTSIPMVVRYPWHTVDSSTALKDAIYGSVYIPWSKGGKRNFLRSPRRVFVSSKSGKRYTKNAHFSTMPPIAQKMVRDYLDEEGFAFGVSKYRKENLDYKPEGAEESVYEKHPDHLIIEEIVEPGVMNTTLTRCAGNMHYFEQVENELRGKKRKFEPPSTNKRLLPVTASDEMAPESVIDDLSIFTAGCAIPSTADGLKPPRSRILSYHYIANSQKDEFEEFIQQKREKKNGSKKRRSAEKAGSRRRRNDK